MHAVARMGLIGGFFAAVGLAPAGLGAAEAQVRTTTVQTTLTALADDALAGRSGGSPGGLQARAWLTQWLLTHGVEPAGDAPGGFEQAIEGGANLVGILPDRDGRTERPAVLLAAHYDGLGTRCQHRAEARSPVCNGAADNAGGVAAVLAAVEALRGQAAQPIAVILWDREEDGLLGSAHFVRQPTFARDGLRLLINLDIIGLNLFRGLEAHHFAIGSETGGEALRADALAALQGAGLEAQRLTYALGHRRSDMTSFVTAQWQLPFVFLSDGDGSVYHTDADEVGVANADKISRVGEAVATLTTAAASRPTAYAWQEPVALGGTYLPTWPDAEALEQLIGRVQGLAAINELSPLQRQSLADGRTRMQAVVARGAGAWTAADGVAVGQTVGALTALSRSLPFVP